MQLSLKRCKQYVAFRPVIHAVDLIRHSSFELGGEKKTKGAALQFVRRFCLIVSYMSDTPDQSELYVVVIPVSRLFRYVSTAAL